MSELSNTSPVVSVFTLTFNQESYIAECIESVLKQDYVRWELLVLDDGSTDGTWSIIQEYAAKDGRIKPIRRENKGLFAMAEAYNLMLANSSGGLIAILDGDDVWPPDKLSVQTIYHAERGFNFTFGLCGAIDSQGRKSSGVFPSRTDREKIAVIEGKGAFAAEYLRGAFPVSAVTCMIDRSSLMRVGGFVQPSYLPTTDYPTWVSVLAAGANAHFIEAELGFWRIQAGQTTWKRAREMALGTLRYSQECAGDVHQSAVMSAGRRGFISDSLYRHAIFSLNERDFAGVRVALSELVTFRGYRSLGKFFAALCFRTARKVLSAVRK